MATERRKSAKLGGRAVYWQKHLARWAKSGLTQAEYCRRRELSAAAFGWWRRQLSKTAKPPIRAERKNSDHSALPKSKSFVELNFRSSDSSLEGRGCAYEIALSNGRVIRMGNNFDAGTLQRLIETVELTC